LQVENAVETLLPGSVLVLGASCLNSSSVRVELALSPHSRLAACAVPGGQACRIQSAHQCDKVFRDRNHTHVCQHVDAAVLGAPLTWVDLLLETHVTEEYENATNGTGPSAALDEALLNQTRWSADNDSSDSASDSEPIQHALRVEISLMEANGACKAQAPLWSPVAARLERLYAQTGASTQTLRSSANVSAHAIVQRATPADKVVGEGYLLSMHANAGTNAALRIVRIVTADTVSVRAMQLLSVAKTRAEVVDVCERFESACVLREHANIPVQQGWPAFSWLHEPSPQTSLSSSPHVHNALWVVDLQRTPECTAQVGSWLIASMPLAKDDSRFAALFTATAARWCDDPQPMVLIKPGFAWPKLLRTSSSNPQWTLMFVELGKQHE
jgi:hypothetical protein